MSLKAFHVFFILLSTALLAGMSFWQMQTFGQSREFLTLLRALLFGMGSLGLLGYLFWFLKKMKNPKKI